MSSLKDNPYVAQSDSTIDTRADDVIELSTWIHAHPELSFEEFQSSAKLTEFLGEAGFDITRSVGGLETAFTATAGTGAVTVGLCVEYDALPAVGHACGHNLIAGASVAAALGLKPLVDELGITLKVIGTPAEEAGGGKQLLIDAGVFDGVDLAMMIHTMAEGLSYSPRDLSMQVVGRYQAVFTGKSSHAAAAPEAGLNAGSAAAIAQVAVGFLRQHITDGQRIAMIVEEAGDVVNIIPEKAVVRFECRTNDIDSFNSLQARLEKCMQAGALATDCSVQIHQVGPIYRELVQDDELSGIWEDAMGRLGYDVTPTPGFAGGSTDMGNVSVILPSIHPFIGIPGVSSPIHTREYVQAANTPEAYTVMIDSAKALAATAIGAVTGENRARYETEK